MRSQRAQVWKVSSYFLHSINILYSEVTMRKGLKDVIVLHPINKYFIQWGRNKKKYERCHRTPSPQQILHTVRSQWAEVWKVSSYSILSINTSYSDQVKMRKGVEGVIILHPLNKYFIQWGHNEKKYERCHRIRPLNKYFGQWSHNDQRYERCHRTPSPQ